METPIVNPIAETEKINKHIALVKTIREKLIHMRCPEFFDGVSDGYEQKFDDHLKEMISITNKVLNSDLPHVVGYVDDLFDEAVISHTEFNRSDMVLLKVKPNDHPPPPSPSRLLPDPHRVHRNAPPGYLRGE